MLWKGVSTGSTGFMVLCGHSYRETCVCEQVSAGRSFFIRVPVYVGTPGTAPTWVEGWKAAQS